MIGTILSHYRIVEELGRGGMGIVYKAEDTKLDRTVAIKVLPASALTSEADRARFYREAKSAAALNHPHIAQVYEIDEAVPEGGSAEEPRPFIAMEFIDGQPLDVRVEEGPLSLEEAVRLSIQVAQALEVAHEKNIVHRDIKAANVMLTKKGEAKVLDFGLAKTAHSTMLTRMGSTLGTVAYMSPEQARGDEVDGRTDLWALGVMLYQLVSGRLPFGGDYEQAVTYSIINENPEPLTAVRTGVPMGLEWIVSKLLAKKAGDRYQTAKDLIVDLRTVDLTQTGLSRTSSVKSMPAAAAASSKRSSSPLDLSSRLNLVFIVLFAGLGALAGWWFTRPALEPPPISQQFDLIIDGIINPLYVQSNADGRLLALMGQDSTNTTYYTYLYDTTTGQLRTVNQNTGDRYFFSPNGTEMAYRQGVFIYTTSVLGGNPKEIGRYGSGWPSWVDNENLLFDFNESLWLHPTNGGPRVQISQVDSLAGEGGHYNATLLPDGKHAVMHITRTTGEVRQLAVLNLESGEHRVIGNGASPIYINSGHLIYVDGAQSASGQMLIRPFDADALEWTGPPAILEESGTIGSWSFDANDTAYYLNLPNVSGLLTGRFVRLLQIDPDSRNEYPFTPPSGSSQPFVSPDGRYILVSVDPDGDAKNDFFTLMDQETGVNQRVPFEEVPQQVSWSDDSKSVFIGVGQEIQKWSVETLRKETSWSAAGFPSTFDVSETENIAIYANHANTDWARLHVLDLESGEDRELTQQMFFAPQFSPDGRYALVLDLRLNLQVVSLEDGSIQPLSPNGEPVFARYWAENGFIFYSVGSELHRVSVSTEPTFRVTGQPESIGSYGGLGAFSVDARGRVIAILDRAFEDASGGNQRAELKVYTNWSQRANQIAPSSAN